jgi:signal transduction histidine kinase
MSVAARTREWVSEHPDLADVLLAAGAFVLSMLPFVLGAEQLRPDLRLTPWTVALCVVGFSVVAVRRRWPLAVWVATTAIGLVAVASVDGPSPAFLAAIMALYTLATTSRLRTTVLAALVSALSPVVVVVALGGSTLIEAFAAGLTAWSALAAVSGVAVRSQRATVAAADERARQAEATREEEAQRRVAEERLRIARELHDVVAHHISVINVQAGVAGHLLRSDPDRAAEAIAHVREASQVVLAEVPGLLGLLRTGEDELARAPVPRLAEADELVEVARRSGLEVTWRSSGTPVELPPGTDLAAYRILQEALTNAARHGTGPALVTVDHDDGGCTIEVRNPMAPGTRGAEETHGLVGMRERAGAVGGSLDVGPGGGGDWVVRARLPRHPGPVAVPGDPR